MGADVVIDNKVRLGREELSALPGLKYIGLLSTGFDVIDVAAAAEMGIAVCNVPSYSTASVVQHTFALLLELAGNVSGHAAAAASGAWGRSGTFCHTVSDITELSGKTLGIIGFGEIGEAVARAAHAFGMNVIACRRKELPAPPFVELLPLKEVAARADILTLHCDLNAGTARLVDAEFISHMKESAVIVNTARGGLVDEQAVADAISDGRLGGYAADVLAEEPPANGSVLLGMPGCIITPHVAWASRAARKRLIQAVADNLESFMRGNTINCVNGLGTAKKTIEVCAALIFREGRFLICRRPAGKKRGLLWEFPGGKREDGETPEQTVARECREELGIEARAIRVFDEYSYEYPDVVVKLTVLETEADGEIRLSEHCAAKWILPSDAALFEFCPADKAVLGKLKARS